ncbi:hypothetical protein [Cesiribacter sp. SM1]|uniref:hypothetical protein n=1 Tax=Cesiribacter sp. SM1 TaxID=2861196 RepID=UPI001CD3329A|nr:hypothetical protein [Cesiribacter sp. SM1]
MANTYETKRDFWLRLDNAAKIYPAIRSTELTSVIRISVELKERIKAEPFSEAIRAIEERFPYYKVILRRGFFWYFLEHADIPIKVMADKGVPCRAFEKDELMFRVLVMKNKVSVEFSHILTDGTGTLEFLKTLLFTYLEKCGQRVPDGVPWLRPGEKASTEEHEDAFNRFFKKTEAPTISIPKAFHVPFSLKPRPRFDVLLGIIPIKETIQKAKEHKVSLTEYLVAVYLYGLQKVHEELPKRAKRRSNKKVRIEVPVNLRNMYPTKTMRNFSLYVMPEIDVRMGWYTFEQLLKVVHHQMQLETDKKLISKMMARNVGGEKNLFIRGVPLFLKSLILSQLYAAGTQKYSGVITNLGKVDFSPEINNHIKRVVFIPPPANKILKVNCGVVGFENKLVLSFGNITESKKLERYFFSFLISQGIPVKIEQY